MTSAYLSPGKQAVLCLPESALGSKFLASPCYNAYFKRGTGFQEVTAELQSFAVVQGAELLQVLLDNFWVPELAALADLVKAHQDEYDDLVEKERVLKALGG